MKKRLLLTLLLPLSVFSQNLLEFNNLVLDSNHSLKRYNYNSNYVEKPIGSPYVNQFFEPATVSNVKGEAPMRYNVFSDEMEFINAKNDTLILNKNTDFNNFHFKVSNKTYDLFNYIDENGSSKNGYLILMKSFAKVSLYQKENITFYEAKIAKTTLEQSMPAKYVVGKTAYYLKMSDGKILSIPSSKKKLIKLFPEKKEIVEAFFKNNDISFNTDSDYLKIAELIDGF